MTEENRVTGEKSVGRSAILSTTNLALTGLGLNLRVEWPETDRLVHGLETFLL